MRGLVLLQVAQLQGQSLIRRHVGGTRLLLVLKVRRGILGANPDDPLLSLNALLGDGILHPLGIVIRLVDRFQVGPELRRRTSHTDIRYVAKVRSLLEHANIATQLYPSPGSLLAILGDTVVLVS